MSKFIFRIFMCLFVICILSLIGINSIFKVLENKGKKIDKQKKLTTSIITNSFLAILLALSSYSLTRNNIDLIKVLCIYLLFSGVLYCIYKLYKNGYKKIVKFAIMPLTLLMCVFFLRILSYLLIDMKFLFPLIISICTITVIYWLFHEVGEEKSNKQLEFNLLYLAGIIFFAIFSWNHLGKDISLITPLSELKVIYHLESKGYTSNEYYTFPGKDLERGSHEFVQVHFKDDSSTYVYEYFYDENVVRQVKIFKDQGVEALHKDGGVEIIE